MAQQRPAYADATKFLDDAIGSPAGQAVVLVGAPAMTREIARQLSEQGTSWFPRSASPDAALQLLNGAAIAGFTPADAARLLTELHRRGDWLMLESADEYLDTPGGRNVLGAVCEAIAARSVPCVIVSVVPMGYPRLKADAFRLLGLAPTVDLSDGRQTRYQDPLAYLIMTMPNATDSGWLVMVGYQLSAPIADIAPRTPDEEAKRIMPLVDDIQVVGRPVPIGVLLSFRAAAFTAGQHERAFAAAEVVARQVVGRRLRADERVEARRGVFIG